ncbi:hypothetical protein GCM10011371_26270 [Novosphingobium marinum]|uniref:Prolyl 4-hydroxylase n=1 Tax=Novosphingobium marinum TaxID=1514948 RepID=A0A7Z0BU37_9SPHN|nr:2OG-Fe(II) oxygenase [Novosphingobium marinum]NYH94758.1 prolyl 4-hydroxylase [Novosphingobium marinum]GGC37502.1 hypothetical protein GCM10011371_26270 [Novosphingobium marinum]
MTEAATTLTDPDRDALARAGEIVRARLDRNPDAFRLPVEAAEIYAVSGFLDPEERDYLMMVIDHVAAPSPTYDEQPAERYRTSYTGDIPRGDPVVQDIDARLSDLLGLPAAWGESLQGQRYYPGQQFKAHHDWFYTDTHYWAREQERGGQRSWTAMAWLNDVEDGGTTDFTRIGVSVPPQAGSLLVWNNALADGSPNHETLHAATPVLAGAKYVFTKWYRTRPWH